MAVFFMAVTDTARKRQGRRSLSLPFDMCAFTPLQRLTGLRLYFHIFLFSPDYAYVFPVSITISMCASSYLSRASTQGISISLGAPTLLQGRDLSQGGNEARDK